MDSEYFSLDRRNFPRKITTGGSRAKLQAKFHPLTHTGIHVLRAFN